MVRTETILGIMIASPDDVKDEREVLDDVISELNLTMGKNLGIRLDPIKWETNTYPAFGTDPQEVINNQIADEYDIFVGILWKKLGKQTPRAESGTVEEFERAYQKYLHDPDGMDIMLYFKDAPSLISEIDPHQLILVNKFRSQVGEKGIYKTFGDRDEFEKLVRMNLSLLIQERSNRLVSKNAVVSKPCEAQASSQLDAGEELVTNEEGFLDLLEIGEENFGDLNEVTKRIIEAIKTIGDKARVRTKEMDQAKTTTTYNIKLAKRASNHMAEDMEIFVALMKAETPQFAKLFTNGIDSYSRAYSLTTDFNKIDKQSLLDSLKSAENLKAAISSAGESITQFRHVVSNLPRLTTAFIQAKRQVLIVLDEYIRQLGIAANLTSEIVNVIQKTIEDRYN